MVGIYKITSPSGRVYIGQTWNFKKRRRDYNCVKHLRQPLILNSLLKYGVYNHIFEIIHELPHDTTQAVLDSYEIFYWRQHIDCGFSMLNTKEPGSGGKHSEESKRKIGDKRRGKVGVKYWLGKNHSEETRIKIGNAGKGRRAWNKGIKCSDEDVDRMKKSHPLRKPVIQFSLEGEHICEFTSIKDASKQTGVLRTSIRECCNKTYRTGGGFYWEYKV